MKILRVIPLYLMNLFLFGGLFFGGIYVSCRFMLGLAMDLLGNPTGLAAIFPKLLALVAGLGGGFWGLMIAAFAARFLARQLLPETGLGEKRLWDVTLGSFVSFLLVVMILIAVFGERTNIGAILEVLLET